LSGGSAGRTLGKADGCAATGAFEVSAARTCFGALAAGAAGVEPYFAAAGLAAEGASVEGVTTGCAAAEGMGREAPVAVGLEVEAPG
jgi:hypothetical protein